MGKSLENEANRCRADGAPAPPARRRGLSERLGTIALHKYYQYVTCRGSKKAKKH